MSPDNDQDATAPLSPQPGAPRTQVQRRATAEHRLLQAAIVLIADRGLERFTLAEVGVAAGYSSGLPAHYYGKKENLVGAVARHIIGRFGEGLERRLTLQPGLEGLLATAGFYFDSSGRDPTASRALAVLLGEALNRPELAGAVAEVNRMGAGELERQIRYGVEQGRIRPDIDAASHAVLILAGLRGAISQWLIDPHTLNLESLRDAYVAALRRSLAA